jgi:hypothetical protein
LYDESSVTVVYQDVLVHAHLQHLFMPTYNIVPEPEEPT